MILYLFLLFLVFFVSGCIDHFFQLTLKSPFISSLISSTISALGIVKIGEAILKGRFSKESQDQTKKLLSDKTKNRRDEISEALTKIDDRINTIIQTKSINSKDILNHCIHLSGKTKTLITDFKSLSALIEDENEH